MTEAKETPFGGFGFAIRTFWIEGSDLSLLRRWSQPFQPDSGPDDLPLQEWFSTIITGKAMCEKDNVCEIGSTQQTKEFELTIRPRAAVSGITDDLYEHSDESIEGSTPESRLSAEIAKQCSKSPPTATLFLLNDNWEIGTKGGWFLDCAVPANVFNQLEAEVQSNLACNLRLGIKWIAGLVQDKYAPPSFPTSWGLFRVPGQTTPDPLYGHVTLITWRLVNNGAAN